MNVNGNDHILSHHNVIWKRNIHSMRGMQFWKPTALFHLETRVDRPTRRGQQLIGTTTSTMVPSHFQSISQ